MKDDSQPQQSARYNNPVPPPPPAVQHPRINMASQMPQSTSGNAVPLTVSDDRSAGSQAEQRNLLALANRSQPISTDTMPTGLVASNATQGTQSLAQHQAQLMLWEQENKRRLMMARAGQAQTQQTQMQQAQMQQAQMQQAQMQQAQMQQAYVATPSASLVMNNDTTGNHALQDYETQMVLLEKQSRKRLQLAREEHGIPQEPKRIARQHPRAEEQSMGFGMFHVSDSNVDKDVQVGPAGDATGTGTGTMRSSSTSEVPSLLNTIDLSGMGADELRTYINHLHTRLGTDAMPQKKQIVHRHQILYRIGTGPHVNATPQQQSFRGPYFDPPEWLSSNDHKPRVRARVPVGNLELHLERNKDISFIVYRTYDEQDDNIAPQRHQETGHIDTNYPPVHTQETIHVVNRDLVKGVKHILDSRNDFAEWRRPFETSNEISGPYVFAYKIRASWRSLREAITLQVQRQLDCLFKYIMETFGAKYDDVDHRLAKKTILPTQVDYVFMPGDILVAVENGQHVGYMAQSRPVYNGVKTATISRGGKIKVGMDPGVQAQMMQSAYQQVQYQPEERQGHSMQRGGSTGSQKHDRESIEVHEWQINAWNWKYDGNFGRDYLTLQLHFPKTREDAHKINSRRTSSVDTGKQIQLDEELGETSLDQLSVFPISYASDEIVQRLRTRGETLWKCRQRRMVSYKETNEEVSQAGVEERYMIDLKTYKSLHKTTWNRAPVRDDLGPEAMARDTPPSRAFTILAQPMIKGYHLRRKKWYDLVIDNITDVTWNREAFNNLVIDHKAKDLIRALVTHQLSSEQSTDLIAGKGNGLILLLHGGPGTGKTLTAESVAEIAGKPLYRVTCGDIGTKVEDVEAYLESVLHLGKIWGCVVLLDEADVFLEQRSLNDLQRNALVSVFLRVLEYYEGILILTSNRVGTFDEAFKSRIQLALHYPNLGPYQRRRIWETFINRLETFDSNNKTKAIESAGNAEEDMDVETDFDQASMATTSNDGSGGPNKNVAVDVADLRAHLDELQAQPMNGRQIRNAITTARQYAEFRKRTMVYRHLKDVIDVAGRFDRYIDDLNGGFTADELAEEEKVRWTGGNVEEM